MAHATTTAMSLWPRGTEEGKRFLDLDLRSKTIHLAILMHAFEVAMELR